MSKKVPASQALKIFEKRIEPRTTVEVCQHIKKMAECGFTNTSVCLKYKDMDAIVAELFKLKYQVWPPLDRGRPDGKDFIDIQWNRQPNVK